VLVETRKGEKVKVFKKIRRQGYRRTQGHRQLESVLRVTGLSGDGKSAKWDGTVDLTTKAEMNARARGLAPRVEAEVEAKPTKVAKPAKAPVEAAPEAEAKTEAKKPAAKKKAAPKADKA
jgi:large subunit ribosomal protein L21